MGQSGVEDGSGREEWGVGGAREQEGVGRPLYPPLVATVGAVVCTACGRPEGTKISEKKVERRSSGGVVETVSLMFDVEVVGCSMSTASNPTLPYSALV